MADAATLMLIDAMQVFVKRDLELAPTTETRDLLYEQMNNALFGEMLADMMENPEEILASTHLLFISKTLERAGDQAYNIVQKIRFLVTGTIFENHSD